MTQEEDDSADQLPQHWRDRLTSRAAWQRAGSAYLMEWEMVWKELAIGFTIAGAIAALVPRSFFEALFPTGLATWLLVPLHALLAPFLAVLTVIGSMGNGPLAAILFKNGVVFGGIMAFLYSDFIVPPSLKINANYYGWRFAIYLGLVFAGAAVVAGVIVHAFFGVVGLLPTSAKSIDDLAAFTIDYTLFLNLFAIAVSGVLIVLSKRATGEPGEAPAPAVS